MLQVGKPKAVYCKVVRGRDAGQGPPADVLFSCAAGAINLLVTITTGDGCFFLVFPFICCFVKMPQVSMAVVICC